METIKIFPKWLQELKRFQALKSVFFLYGNVYDCYYFPKNYSDAEAEKDLKYGKYNDVKDLLQDYLLTQGFDLISYFDVIDGISVKSKDDSVTIDNLLDNLQLKNKDSESHLNDATGKKPIGAISFFREMMGNSQKLSAGIINFASRFTSNPNALEDEAKPLFLKLIKAAQESCVFTEKEGKRNILIFICDKLNDIPVWVLLENPLTKGIEIQKPDREERRRFFTKRSKQFYTEGAEPDIDEIERWVNEFKAANTWFQGTQENKNNSSFICIRFLYYFFSKQF